MRPHCGRHLFVQRDGKDLYVGDNVWNPIGVNIFGCNKNGTIWTPPDSSLTAIQAELGKKKMHLMRAWFFQPMFVTNGQRDWTKFDNTLRAAQSHCVKVMVVLANEWAAYDGISVQRPLSWWEGGYTTQVDTGSLVPYRDWVSEVVTRYKDDPTIACWQLVNEGEARESDGTTCTYPASTNAIVAFADDIGALIRNIDANHLISIGTIPGECGSNEASYSTLNGNQYNDICVYHDYGYPESSMSNTDSYNGLQTTINRTNVLDKPLLIGEMGIHGQPGAYSLADRATYFEAKFADQTAAGISGLLIWNWDPTPGDCGTACNYELGPDDPTWPILAAYI